MKLVLYNDKIWKVVARFSEYILHPEVHKLAFLRPRTSKFTGWIWFSLPNYGPKVYLHFIPIFRSSQFTGRIWSDDGPEPSYLISNSNIAELVSLVTSQQWVSPFLSESDETKRKLGTRTKEHFCFLPKGLSFSSSSSELKKWHLSPIPRALSPLRTKHKW